MNFENKLFRCGANILGEGGSNFSVGLFVNANKQYFLYALDEQNKAIKKPGWEYDRIQLASLDSRGVIIEGSAKSVSSTLKKDGKTIVELNGRRFTVWANDRTDILLNSRQAEVLDGETLNKLFA